MDLANKIAVVTGANKGIGLECVNQLLQRGAVVYGVCRSGCTTQHANFTCLHADVGNAELVETLLNILLCCPQRCPFSKLHLSQVAGADKGDVRTPCKALVRRPRVDDQPELQIYFFVFIVRFFVFECRDGGFRAASTT